MRSASVCGGGGVDRMISSAELHCKFQRSVIPPNYSTTDSDCRGAISVHSGLKKTDGFVFSKSVFNARSERASHAGRVGRKNLSPVYFRPRTRTFV